MRKYFYLQHSLTAAYDPRMDNLIEKEGMKGYGAYWYIMEKLELMPETRATLDYMQPFCRRRGVSFKYIQKIIFEYDLFIIDEDGFFMPEELNPIRGNNRDFSKNNKSNPDFSKNIEENIEENIENSIENNIEKPAKTVEKRAKNFDKSTENDVKSTKNDAKLTKNDAKSTENEQKKAENVQKLSKNDAETSREKSPKSLNTNDLCEFTREYIRDIRDIITTTTEKEKEKTAADDDNPDIRSPQPPSQPIGNVGSDFRQREVHSPQKALSSINYWEKQMDDRAQDSGWVNIPLIAPLRYPSYPAMLLPDWTERLSGIPRHVSAYRKSGRTKCKHSTTGNEACQQGKRTGFSTETSLISRQNQRRFGEKRAAFRAETNGISDRNEFRFRRRHTSLCGAGRSASNQRITNFKRNICVVRNFHSYGIRLLDMDDTENHEYGGKILGNQCYPYLKAATL